MNKSLEKLIEGRIKEAVDLKIAFYATEIAIKMGVCESGLEAGGKFFERYIFKSREFRIETYTRWPTDIKDGGYEEDWMYINDRRSRIPGGNVFFKRNEEISVYRPDYRWEHEIGILYNQFLSEEEKRVQAEKKKLEEAEEADLRDRFGL